MGCPPVQGKRNDIAIKKEALENGANIRDIISTSTNNQVIQYAAKWLTYFEKERNWHPEVWWFWGPTSTGKSHRAFEIMNDPAKRHIQRNSSKWWDGYDAHEDVIIEEYRGSFCKFSELLGLLDKYPLKVEVKYGFRSFLAKRIIITSNQSPQQIWWSRTEEQTDQLLRRINHIEHMTIKYTGK